VRAVDEQVRREPFVPAWVARHAQAAANRFLRRAERIGKELGDRERDAGVVDLMVAGRPVAMPRRATSPKLNEKSSDFPARGTSRARRARRRDRRRPRARPSRRAAGAARRRRARPA
jgi:hypothetical protein